MKQGVATFVHMSDTYLMAMHTTHLSACLPTVPSKGTQALPIRKKAKLLQGIREDYHLAESMAYGRRLRGDDVSKLSDDELIARVRAAYTPR